MKLKKTEYGVEFEPETDYEKECLAHLAKQTSISATYKDRWDHKFPLIVEGKPHSWNAWDEKK